jgi:hypothetical protein
MASAAAAALGAPAHAQASGTVQPYYGNIRPFYGNLRPFYGNLRPFYGNLRPFYGNIRPFWGSTAAFWGNLQPFATTKDPSFWGTQKGYVDVNNVYDGAQVGAFWNTEGTKYNSLLSAWSTASTPAAYAAVAQQLSAIVGDASSFWGPEVKKYTHATTFAAGYSNAMLAKYGIDLNNPSTLANLDPNQQAMFLLDWYDGLMSFSGAGHVDWWMGATGWTPNLGQIAGGTNGMSSPVTIGMLDLSVSPTGAQNVKGTITQYGSNVYGDGHGAAVGSLIMSSIDGSNIMGVLPPGDAKITVYDPYDATGTTNWTDVGIGINTLTSSFFSKGKGPAADPVVGSVVPVVNSLVSNGLGPLKVAPVGSAIGVINASLGEPGWTLSPGWNTALASGSAKYSILVVAAGNDGAVQPGNVKWSFAVNPTLLVVGSVGLDGTISNFSNTPGETCLTDTASGQCDKLKNHFLVAPGELILVSDGHGGVSRQTGTSLAAPLVSGAIGLLEARWPWLASHPDETAQIILQSATPIHSAGYTGTGPDPVYGWGELNIAASQSPLNWRNMVYMQSTNGLKAIPVSVSQVVAQVKTGAQASWNSSKLYFTAIERVGATYRDFQVPMAASLIGQNVSTLAGQQLFQSYLTGPLKSWVGAGAPFADSRTFDPAVASFVASSQSMGQFGGLDLRLHMGPGQTTPGFRQTNAPIDMDFALVGDRQSLRMGFGEGAAALSGQPGLSGAADFQLGRGGANPLLGLASGGAFADWRVSVLKGLSVSFGATQRKSWRDLVTVGPEQQSTPAAFYGAHAENLGVDYAFGRRVALHAAMTWLREDAGLLGIQSLQSNALQDGSASRAASFGVDVSLTPTLALSASGTIADTHTVGVQNLRTAEGGLTSTAAEIAVTKAAVFDRNDRLRLTLSKPMQVISGSVRYTDYGVVDRTTGQLGLIDETQSAASGRTPLAAELFYGRLLDNGTAEASVFVRGGVNTAQFGSEGRTDYMIGYRYQRSF